MNKTIRVSKSDAGGDGGGGDDDGGDFPTTLPAWQGPRGYHGQGSNIPFGESLTLTIQYNTIPYNTIQYHSIPYNTIAYDMIMLSIFYDTIL